MPVAQGLIIGKGEYRAEGLLKNSKICKIKKITLVLLIEIC